MTGISTTLRAKLGIGVLIVLLGLPFLASHSALAQPRQGSNSAGDFSATGWNTWDIARPNAMVHLPDGIVLDLSIYNSHTGQPLGRVLLNDVQRFGTHAPNGSYCLARYKQGDFTYEIEFAVRGTGVIAHVHPMSETDNLLIAEFSFDFGHTGRVEKQGSRVIVSGEGSHFYASSPNPEKQESSLSSERRMVWDLNGDRWVTFSTDPKQTNSAETSRAQVEEIRKTYENERVRSGGLLEDSAQAASDAVAWNIVWNAKGQVPVATVAREFPTGSGVVWGGYIQGGWDAILQGLQADLQSPSMAEASVLGLLLDASSKGFIPNVATGWGLTEDRSEPPLAAYAALKLYREHDDRQFLEKAYPILCRWHDWWPTARDGNHDGLLEWGSTPPGTHSFLDFTNQEIDGLKSAYRRLGFEPPPIQFSDMVDNIKMAGDESGLDNSPMWDGVKFNKQTHTMEQDDVGLSSLWALDGWALAEIAHILGRSQEEQKYRQDFHDVSARVNELMWSEADGMYFNRSWDGTFNKRISTTNFHPLLAGIASPERAQRMVQQYLLNTQKFWGEYIVPATPRDDPAFKDQDYWRGRIWGPTNYLLYQGLKRVGLDDVAAQVAAKSTLLFLKEWHTNGHIHENYNTMLGIGDDVTGSSVRYYAWGGLLPLTMVEDLIDVEPWSDSGLRLGSLIDRNVSATNVWIGKDNYDVSLGPGLRVVRNGKKLLEADHPVVLRNVVWEKERVRFNVTAKTGGRITLCGFGENEKVQCTSCLEKKLIAHEGNLVIEVGPEVKSVNLVRNP
jgi:putative isomerase